MAYQIKESQSNIGCGLGTYTHTVKQAGFFNMSAQCVENPPSGMSIAIQLNGTPIKTGTITSTEVAQQTLNVRIDNVSCAVNDVISFVLTSSAANDQGLNTVKTTFIATRVG